MPQKPKRSDLLKKPLRAKFKLEGARAIDEEARTVEIAFSSDAEVEQWWRTILVLEHTAEACDLGRLNNGAIVLFNHQRDKYVGVVESARVDADGKGRAVVRFGRGKFAEEIFRDVSDGIIRKVSFQFDVHELKLVETRDDDVDVYRATKWEPYEISFVTIPLDDSVGVGRGSGAPDNLNQEARDMPVPEPTKATPPAAPPVDVAAERQKAQEEERSRTADLLALGRSYNAQEDAERFVSEGKTTDQFRQFLLEKLDGARQTPSKDELNAPVGLTEKEIARYSFIKVIRALDPNNRRAQEEAAFEFEVSAAAAAKLGRDAQGVVVPVEVLTAPVSRTYSTDTAAAPHGGATVGTSLLASSFIEMLRKRCLLMQMGTQLGGLVGNVDIPKQVGGATAYVVGEDNDAQESEGDFGSLALTPYTIGALSQISRRLLMQSSLDVEALVRADLAKAVGLKMDNLGFYGTGADEPTGIKATSGVNAIAIAASLAPTFRELVQLESEVSADDADVESMAYILNARMRGHCKTTPKFANTEATIWEPGNTVNGYRAGVTNQVLDSDVFFGNWADMLIALWGGLELTLDPYTGSAAGRLRIIAMQDMDLGTRHAESFCVGTYTAG